MLSISLLFILNLQALGDLSHDKRYLFTIGDPIEVTLKNVNQMNLNKKLGIDFSSGLRNILRQDPDVIMIGEIRDKETADMCIRASITGHKVYSTLHCKSPREVYLRLINMGVDSNLLVEALGGIISQKLIKILCDDCKEIDNVNKYKNFMLFKKRGCKNCNYTGYITRKLISSVYYLKNSNKKNIEEIYADKNYLCNTHMKSQMEELIAKGKIPYADYFNFLEGEDLNEL
ncbi:GspE/PulE family protein [Clostridium neonatale]|uniref:Type IV pilus assembly ATPase protein PilB n=4 Tax=Clostridium neonatale TaxID=137838 RepID=A0AAD2DD32_9CLOT